MYFIKKSSVELEIDIGHIYWLTIVVVSLNPNVDFMCLSIIISVPHSTGQLDGCPER